MELAQYLVALVALCVGSVAQRTVGMGFGLVVAPLMVLVIGPLEAVLIVNVYGIVSCTIIVARVWHDIDWRKLAWLVIPAIALTIPGILIAAALDTDALKVLVGIVSILGVIASVLLTRSTQVFDGPVLRMSLGGLTGLLNSSVAVAAPVIGVIGIVTRWEHRVYAATLQPFWVLLSTSTVLARTFVAPGGAPDWPWWAWILGCIPLVAGIVIGDAIAPRLNQNLARKFVIAFSLLAGIAVLASGLAALLT